MESCSLPVVRHRRSWFLMVSIGKKSRCRLKPRALVADQNDRVWIAMDDGLGFIQRDAMGAPRFSRFELPKQDADLDFFSMGFKTSNGVRFGCFKMLAEIDCSADEPSITIYRAKPKENFLAWDGDVFLLFFRRQRPTFLK